MNKKILYVLSILFTFVLMGSVCVYAGEVAGSKNLSDKATSSISEQQRSAVANFVQTLWGSSARLGGIGEKVREIARAQSSSSNEIPTMIDAINNRSALKTFLIGTDYKNIGKLRSAIASTTNNLKQLTLELNKISTTTDKTAIVNQIKLLEAEQVKLSNFLKTNENKISLFGWFVKIFTK